MNVKKISLFILLVIVVSLCAGTAGYFAGRTKPKNSARNNTDFERFIDASRDFITRERAELNQSRINIERDRQRLDRQRSAIESERIRLERERTALDGDRHSVEQLDSLITETIDILEGR